jgi:hypothetical protein
MDAVQWGVAGCWGVLALALGVPVGAGIGAGIGWFLAWGWSEGGPVGLGGAIGAIGGVAFALWATAVFVADQIQSAR